MAPSLAPVADALVRRYYYYGNDYYYSPWYSWGRWVVVGACILIALLAVLICGCARRRRRRGMTPMYGTGWMAGGGGQQPNYAQNPQQHEMGQMGYPPQQQQGPGGYYNQPPAYGQNPQYTGTTFNPNEGYYGNQQYNVQQPPNAYQRDGEYAPPHGMPPGKQ